MGGTNREEGKEEKRKTEKKKRRGEGGRSSKKVWKLTLSMDSSKDHMDFAWNCMEL